jgi:hypothetical protein
MSCTNKSTDTSSQSTFTNTHNQARPGDSSQPAMNLFSTVWNNGSVTTVSEYQQDKRVAMFNNLCITNTTFPARGSEEEIFKRISDLNMKELHGVYIYDQENSKIIYRTVNHYKKAIFEGEESKYKCHLEENDCHRNAEIRFFA